MKRFVCLFLVISLVFACSGSAFAAPELVTGSAFAIDDRLLTSSLFAASASAPVGSSTDPFYVRPYNNGSATVYRYSWSQTNPNGSSSGFNQTFTNFADIVTHITNSIANSFLSLGQRLHYDNDAIYGRLYDILTAIQRTAPSDVVKITSNADSKFSYSYLWKKYLTNPSGTLSTMTNYGSLSDRTFDFDSNSILGALEAITYYNGQGTFNAVSLLGKNVIGHSSSSNDYLTNSDLSTTELDSRFDSSLWANMRDYFTNVSDHLAHLRYVLANDEDIEARDASNSVRQAYTNDFLKPSGSASASASDFGTLASGSSSLSDSFHSSYGASDALGSLSDQGDGRWDWFSQSTMDNLNSSGNRSSSMLKSNRGYTNFYEERYRAIKHD